MNLPNKLTVLRILLVPFFVWLLLNEEIAHNFLFAGAIFGIACLTDRLDGQIARKLGQVTVFGKFFDPLADKILVMAAFLCFIEKGLFSCVPVIFILLREFIVISVRLAAAEHGEVIAANFWGKAKTLSQMVAILFVVFLLYLESLGICRAKETIFWGNIVLWFCVAMTLISGAVYVFEWKSFLDKNGT